jgi:hypothetical protein
MNTAHSPAERLDAALHSALDRRVEPLADPELLDALAEHPEGLSEVLRLAAALSALPLEAPQLAPARRRSLWALPLGLAAAAGLLWCAWSADFTSMQPRSSNQNFVQTPVTPNATGTLASAPVSPRAPALLALEFSVEVKHPKSSERSRVVLSPDKPIRSTSEITGSSGPQTHWSITHSR